MVSETLGPLKSMTPIMVLKVFLKYRRSAFQVDLASQKSLNIYEHLQQIRKNGFVNRAQKNTFFYRFCNENMLPKAPALAPESTIKASTKELFVGRASRKASGPLLWWILGEFVMFLWSISRCFLGVLDVFCIAFEVCEECARQRDETYFCLSNPVSDAWVSALAYSETDDIRYSFRNVQQSPLIGCAGSACNKQHD